MGTVLGVKDEHNWCNIVGDHFGQPGGQEAACNEEGANGVAKQTNLIGEQLQLLILFHQKPIID